MLLLNEEITVSDKEIRALFGNPQKSAELAHLVYVNDTLPGIKRVKKGKKFVYLSGSTLIQDESELSRIKRIVIPPAWQKVWICPFENGHIQATGLDARNRKQYRYHPLWCSLRNHAKFYRLLDFGKAIPSIRKSVSAHLKLQGLPAQKVLAAIVTLMECTCIRIGNHMYEKLYGSFGLTTLKRKHVSIEGSRIQFEFKGKKGVMHKIRIRNERMAAVLKECLQLPGTALLKYKNARGEVHEVDSAMVNDYIKSISGRDFSAKDFRTWAGSAFAIKVFKNIPYGSSDRETKRSIVAVLDKVAAHLGNTRSVCKKYYVHPLILSLYENRRLHGYLDNMKHMKCKRNDLCCEEKVLMRILEKEMSALN